VLSDWLFESFLRGPLSFKYSARKKKYETVLYNTDYSYSQQRDLQVIKMAHVRSLILLKMSALHWLTFPFSDPFHQIPLTSITTDTPQPVISRDVETGMIDLRPWKPLAMSNLNYINLSPPPTEGDTFRK
jgi:hypothetical protein